MNLRDMIASMTIEQVEARSREIANEINLEGADVDALSEETDLLIERKQAIKDEAAKRKATLEKIANGNLGQNTVRPSAEVDNGLDSMNYRKAFMDFCQRGIRSDILIQRTPSEQVSSDLGILLPNTIVQEIIKGVQEVHGQLFARVKKLNVKGGLQFPIGSFSASLVWSGQNGTDTEHGVSDNQKAGGITDYVQFTYFIGEVRVAQSLLESVLTVEVFEREVVNVVVEGFVKGMDMAILEGTGVNQPTGIFTNVAAGLQRIPTSNIIEMTASDVADWTKWQSKLFAKIPLSMRKERPMFHMTAETFEANLMTLKDTTNQPIAKEGYNPVTGDEVATFRGRTVEFIEESTNLKSFDNASAGEYFGIYWIPDKAYAINTNMQFSYKRYFDENTNQWITKCLVIVDGKILDPKYIYLLKKK